AASRTDRPSRLAFSAYVTRRIAFATEMPMAMIAPMNDCTFSVVPVTSSINNTPQSTAGTAEMTAKASRNDWKFAANKRKITRIESRRPLRRPSSVSSNAGTCPRLLTVIPRGGAPARAIACRMSVTTRPSGLPWTFAVDLDLKRRIVERLRILQVAQRVDLHELRPDLLGEGARRRECRTLYRDLDGSRRAEAHDLTDDVGRLEGDRHVGQRLLQVVT